MSRFSLLQIDVEVEEPETSENPTQLFEIHKYRLEAHTAFGCDNIYGSLMNPFVQYYRQIILQFYILYVFFCSMT